MKKILMAPKKELCLLLVALFALINYNTDTYAETKKEQLKALQKFEAKEIALMKFIQAAENQEEATLIEMSEKDPKLVKHALLAAAAGGQLQAIYTIIDLINNTDVINARDEAMNTPLHLVVQNVDPALAVDRDRLFIVSALLYAGANRDAKNTQGKTPLDIARSLPESPFRDLIEAELKRHD